MVRPDITAMELDLLRTGDDQLNKIYGRVTMALFQHRKPEMLPSFDAGGGTPNQKDERESILLRAFSASDPLAEKALDHAIASEELQARYGFMLIGGANEYMSDSHWPIWLRAKASKTTTAWERRQDPRLGAKYRYLLQLLTEFWGRFLYLCNHCEVPSGPKVEHIVTVGARFRNGDSEERNISYGLLIGQAPAHVASGRFWRNAEVFQDTFGCFLLRRLMEQGALNRIAQIKPVSPTEVTATRYRNGLKTEVTSGVLQKGDPAFCWVRYDDGVVNWTDPAPDLGPQINSEVITTVS